MKITSSNLSTGRDGDWFWFRRNSLRFLLYFSLFYSLHRIELTWIAQAGIALDAIQPSLMLDNPWWLLMIILDGRSLAHIWPATPPSMMVILELIATHEMGTMINHLINFWDHRCIWAHLIWFAFTFTATILSSIYIVV